MTLMFCATKNFYEYTPATLESLFQTNPNVERVYLFIEDDIFPYELDPRVEVINLHKMEQYLDKDSPNYNTPYSIMTMVRCYVSKYLIEDKIIYVDIDVLFTGDITSLWEIDMGDNLVCAVPEDESRTRYLMHINNDYARPYFNAGVIMLNLRAIRDEGKDDWLMEMLNSKHFPYPDQDVLNIVCKNRIIYLPNKYNSCIYTGGAPGSGVIIHMTPDKAWNYDSVYNKLWKKYDSYKKEI